MAEENIDSPVTPETNEFDRKYVGKVSFVKSGSLAKGHGINSGQHRASLGSYHDSDNSTRNSTGKPDSPISSQRPVPHYLRASTGSCHDFCKYGRKHAFEATARRPLPKRMIKPESNKQNPEKTTFTAEQKKEMVVEHKLIPDADIHSPIVKSHSPKSKPFLDTKVHSPKKKISSGLKTGKQKHEASRTTKTLLMDPPEIIKREILLPSKKTEVGQKQDALADNKIPKNEKKTSYSSKKHSPSAQLKPMVVKSSSSRSDPPKGINGKVRKNSDIKTGRKMGAPTLSQEKKLAPLASSLSPKLSLSRTISLKAGRARSLKSASHLNNQNRMHKTETKISTDEVVPERTLHVIKMETGSNISESIPTGHVIPSIASPVSPKSLSNAISSSQSSHEQKEEEEEEEADYTDIETDEYVSDNDTTEEIAEIQTSEDNHKAHRKSTVSEDDGAHLKLKFRRGTVVNLQSDNNSPRRLRFRRGRVLAEDQNGRGDLRRRIFKKGGSGDGKNGAGLSPKKVVLKHQDVQGKKDAQGLFNNVIEETASKLVESRKSKVKALVGAFETVISLQESKPSLQTVA